MKLARTSFVAVVALALAALPAMAAGDTGWLNRDKPSGKGDYEMVKDLFKVACRFKDDQSSFTDGSVRGYRCTLPEGAWCENAGVPGGNCRDVEVQYTWSRGTTGWLNRDNPSGDGDYETFKDQFKIECRFANPQAAITDGVPPGYACRVPQGGYCENTPNLACRDMEVKFTW